MVELVKETTYEPIKIKGVVQVPKMETTQFNSVKDYFVPDLTFLLDKNMRSEYKKNIEITEEWFKNRGRKERKEQPGKIYPGSFNLVGFVSNIRYSNPDMSYKYITFKVFDHSGDLECVRHPTKPVNSS